ncbi:MAG: hypothetical protein RBT36_10070 [Desulfobulbus sp.]|nr:hypothetical protein [Desulfobulbus sp.]
MECAIVDAQDSTILYAKHLPLNLRIGITKKKISAMSASESTDSSYESENFQAFEGRGMSSLKAARGEAIAAQEEKYLRRLLAVCDGNVTKCCQISGLARSRFYDLLKKYQLALK